MKGFPSGTSQSIELRSGSLACNTVTGRSMRHEISTLQIGRPRVCKGIRCHKHGCTQSPVSCALRSKSHQAKSKSASASIC
eukprot:1725875-Amphidinium_carterae.1